MNKEKLELLKENAKLGKVKAQEKLGDFYFDGFKNRDKTFLYKPNKKLAFKWFNIAASNGSFFAKNMLANFYMDGLQCELDYKKAFDLYQESIHGGFAMAALNVGKIYRDIGKYQKAFEYYLLYQKLLKSDYSIVVALSYYFGIGTEKNISKAIQIFKKIILNKNKTVEKYEIQLAHYFLTFNYLSGENVKQSINSGRKHLELCHKYCMSNVAISHVIGIEKFKITISEARKLEHIQFVKYDKTKNIEDIAYNLQCIFRNSNQFYDAFMIQNRYVGVVSLTLAFIYYFGIGTVKNKKIAFEMYKKVVNIGTKHFADYEIKEANYMIGLMYLNGEEVKKSITKARKYLQKANENRNHKNAHILLYMIGFPHEIYQYNADIKKIFL